MVYGYYNYSVVVTIVYYPVSSVILVWIESVQIVHVWKIVSVYLSNPQYEMILSPHQPHLFKVLSTRRAHDIHKTSAI